MRFAMKISSTRVTSLAQLCSHSLDHLQDIQVPDRYRIDTIPRSDRVNLPTHQAEVDVRNRQCPIEIEDKCLYALKHRRNRVSQRVVQRRLPAWLLWGR